MTRVKVCKTGRRTQFKNSHESHGEPGHGSCDRDAHRCRHKVRPEDTAACFNLPVCWWVGVKRAGCPGERVIKKERAKTSQ